MGTPTTVRRALAAALLLGSTPARAEVQPLHVDLRWDLPVTIGAAAGALVFALPWATPGECKWCTPGQFDTWVRDELRLANPAPARTASDVLAVGVLPVAALANSWFSSRAGGAPTRVFWEDTLVIAQAVSITAFANEVTKDVTARRRPSAGMTATGASNQSFFSGHTSSAFALAASAGTVSTMRGYASAPWVWAGGMTLATAVGYLRVAGDAHWATDVLAGAGVGGLVGFAVPWFFHRAEPGAKVTVLPAPGGFALVF
jgi:membrane-associated phospholipid phosphatase